MSARDQSLYCLVCFVLSLLNICLCLQHQKVLAASCVTRLLARETRYGFLIRNIWEILCQRWVVCLTFRLISLFIIQTSVLLAYRPLIRFIRNYIRDSSGVFSMSSLVRISMTSFPALTLFFVQKYSCLYNKKKITRGLEDMNIISSW